MIPFFSRKTIAVIVAHPDDETLWAGGTILNHPFCDWYVVCLSRGNDIDRAPKFYNTLKALHANGVMGFVDDGPDQIPLDILELKRTIIDLLPPKSFDIVMTHNPSGEYTKHLRHEEVSKAVIALWIDGKISAKELRTFAYEDGNKAYMPKAIEDASIYNILTKKIWQKKYAIIHEIYGFTPLSWEVLTTPRIEAFWKFTDKREASKWLQNKGILKEKKSVQFEKLRSLYYDIVSKVKWRKLRIGN
jgi:hypothetical protein